MEAEELLGFSSIEALELEEISLPSSTVIEGLLQDHPSLLSVTDESQPSLQPDPDPSLSSHSSDLEVTEESLQPIFQVTEKVVKTGPKKGKTEKKVTLILGQNIFKRRKNLRNGSVLFTCNGCENAGVYLSAVASVTNEGGVDQYNLTRAPDSSEHACCLLGDVGSTESKDR